MDNEIIEKFDKIYKMCIDVFTSDTEMDFNCSSIKDKKKMKLFAYISDFFLQDKQEEVIKNEAY